MKFTIILASILVNEAQAEGLFFGKSLRENVDALRQRFSAPAVQDRELGGGMCNAPSAYTCDGIGAYATCGDAIDCINSGDIESCWNKNRAPTCCDFGFDYGMKVVEEICKTASNYGPEPWCVVEDGNNIGEVQVGCLKPESVEWSTADTPFVFEGVFRKAGNYPLVGDLMCGPTWADNITQPRKPSSYVEFCWNKDKLTLPPKEEVTSAPTTSLAAPETDAPSSAPTEAPEDEGGDVQCNAPASYTCDGAGDFATCDEAIDCINSEDIEACWRGNRAPTCCDFGFDYGMKVVEDICKTANDYGPEPWCVVEDGNNIGDVQIGCSKPESVEWNRGATPFVFEAVFRKSGSYPLVGDLACGPTWADNITQPRKATAYVEFCWNKDKRTLPPISQKTIARTASPSAAQTASPSTVLANVTSAPSATALNVTSAPSVKITSAPSATAVNVTSATSVEPSSVPSALSLTPTAGPTAAVDEATTGSPVADVQCHLPDTTYACDGSGFFDTCVEATDCIESGDPEGCWSNQVLNCCDFGFDYGMTVVDEICRDPEDYGPEPWCVMEDGQEIGTVDVTCDNPLTIGWSEANTPFVFEAVFRKAGRVPLIDDLLCGPSWAGNITQPKRATAHLEFCWNKDKLILPSKAATTPAPSPVTTKAPSVSNTTTPAQHVIRSHPHTPTKSPVVEANDPVSCIRPSSTYSCEGPSHFDSCESATACIESADPEGCWKNSIVHSCCDYGFDFGMTVLDDMCRGAVQAPEPWCVIEEDVKIGWVTVGCTSDLSVEWSDATPFVFDGVFRKAGKVPLVGDLTCGPTWAGNITQAKKTTAQVDFCWNKNKATRPPIEPKSIERDASPTRAPIFATPTNDDDLCSEAEMEL